MRGAVNSSRPCRWPCIRARLSCRGRCTSATNGGRPLKIIWLLLDLAAIVVLGSGVYLAVAQAVVPRRGRSRIDG
jgi:uncharacterized iron-regulated membrane protein